MRYQITMQSRDRDQRPFVVEIEAETGDEAADKAVAAHPGFTASNIYPAGDAIEVDTSPHVAALAA